MSFARKSEWADAKASEMRRKAAEARHQPFRGTPSRRDYQARERAASYYHGEAEKFTRIAAALRAKGN